MCILWDDAMFETLSCTGVPRPEENAPPPRTPLGHEAEAYGRVLVGCVFLKVRYPRTLGVVILVARF